MKILRVEKIEQIKAFMVAIELLAEEQKRISMSKAVVTQPTIWSFIWSEKISVEATEVYWQ